MTDKQKNLWEAVYSIWMKYCGIADEYKMLRDRWLYHKSEYYPILPDLKSKFPTFSNLQTCIETLDEFFCQKFDLERIKPEIFETKFDGTLNDLENIENLFLDLSRYVGLLKIAFFQRTVSMEIPHAVGGLPHSPERTIGNELIYVAADQLTQQYRRSFRISYWDWDGFVTFLPPIQSGYFYGAILIPFPRQKLYHISMSEEQKYFVGSYIHLGHELGHTVTRRPSPHTYGDVEYSPWFKALARFSCDYTNSVLGEFIPKDCRGNCPMHSNINSTEEFEQFICDLISYKIAGVFSQIALIDEELGPKASSIFDIIVRSKGILQYLEDSRHEDECSHILKERIQDIMKEVDGMSLPCGILDCREVHEIYPECISCWGLVGASYGRATQYFDSNFEEEIQNRNNWSADQEKLILESLGDVKIAGSLFSHIIERAFEMEDKDKKIEYNLIEGIPCFDEDPRKVIHYYYKAFGKNKDEYGPNYASTIQCLAFNEFK
ncbi:MAG: hypothetical protein HXS54_08565 [Theionarchaea archaeon]|nr:hypothetical protein [Theionarchaea archaeon]